MEKKDGDNSKKKEVCKCVNCGNEAEMEFTCSLEDVEDEEKKEQPPAPKPGEKLKGTATCTHCGNEADMWIEF
jgi:ribosomal protein S14